MKVQTHIHPDDVSVYEKTRKRLGLSRSEFTRALVTLALDTATERDILEATSSYRDVRAAS